MYFHISTKGQPGSAWSPEEITRTKERIWKILVNPKKFVGKTKKPKEHGDCGSDCWKDCDAFDQGGRDHPFCTHCEDVVCPDNFPKCQCCTGWSVGFRSLESRKVFYLSSDCLHIRNSKSKISGARCPSARKLQLLPRSSDFPSMTVSSEKNNQLKHIWIAGPPNTISMIF